MNLHVSEASFPAWKPADHSANPADLVTDILRLAHRLRSVLASHFAEFGLSDARFAVLEIVRDAAPRGCTQTELAERLQQSESSVSTLVDRMRAADLLYRLRSKSDRRKCHLVLTDHARETLGKLQRCHNERMGQLLSCFSTAQLLELSGLLALLDAELQRREVEGVESPAPAESAVLPHPRLSVESADVPLRPAG